MTSSTKFQPLTWTEWLAAWNVYQFLVAQHNISVGRNVIGGLAKHFQQVLQLLKAGHDWQLYDSEFRWAIQHDSSVQWGHILSQALDNARNSRVPHDNQVKRKGGNHQAALPSRQGWTVKTMPARNFPTKFCWTFNKGNSCSNISCKNSHHCFNCNDQKNAHAFVNCTQPLAFPNWPHKSISSGKHNPQAGPSGIKTAFLGKSS